MPGELIVEQPVADTDPTTSSAAPERFPESDQSESIAKQVVVTHGGDCVGEIGHEMSSRVV